MLKGCERAFRLIFSLLLEKSLFVTDKTFFALMLFRQPVDERKTVMDILLLTLESKLG